VGSTFNLPDVHRGGRVGIVSHNWGGEAEGGKKTCPFGFCGKGGRETKEGKYTASFAHVRVKKGGTRTNTTEEKELHERNNLLSIIKKRGGERESGVTDLFLLDYSNGKKKRKGTMFLAAKEKEKKDEGSQI